MLAYKYKQHSSCNDRISFERNTNSNYLTLIAENFVEPTGVHIYSIHNKTDKNESLPFFKTNVTNDVLVPTRVKYHSSSIGDNKFPEASTRAIYVSSTMLTDITNNYTKNANLSVLAQKFATKFTAGNINSGIVALIPTITSKFVYGISTIKNKTISVNYGENLVVKIVAKIPVGFSLKYTLKKSVVPSSCSNYSSCLNKTIPNFSSCYVETDNLNCGFLTSSNNLVAEVVGNGNWTEYTFVIDRKNSGGRIFITDLVFYAGYSYNRNATINTLGSYDKYVYIAYLDILLLNSKYTYLKYYCPFEDTTTVKNGIIYNKAFLETTNPKSTVGKHDIVLKKEN